MTIPEKAVDWAVRIAEDDSHGYDQSFRWGPDYDCSSFVIKAYQKAGVPLTCTYTGNMRSNMLDNGFVIPVSGIDLNTGSGLEPGDVLLNTTSHTAMYIGNGQIVQARINENGQTTGGQTGDQTHQEVCISRYYNFPWNFVLRYVRKEAEPEPPQEAAPQPTDDSVYIVQKGDTLWGLAERFLGHGYDYPKLMTVNELTDTTLYPGQQLIIPGTKEKKTISVTVSKDTYDVLQIMAEGLKISLGAVIDKLCEDAI